MSHRFGAILCIALAAAACSSEAEDGTDGDECMPADCSARGLNCGPITDESGTCLFCGFCTEPDLCGGGGQANVCGCTPKQCGVGDCGTINDGCGGSVECGDSCVAPETCVQTPSGGHCGRLVCRNEPCDDENICEPGLLCCEIGGPPRCERDFATGQCPEPLPDLVPDEAFMRRTLRTSTIMVEDVPGTQCEEFEDCQMTPGTRRLVSFVAGIINDGIEDLVVGEAQTGEPPFKSIECFPPERADIGLVRVLSLPSQTLMLSARRTQVCLQDTMQFDPLASSTARFDRCLSSDVQGIQAGWEDLDALGFDGDCQHLDITDLDPGDYLIEFVVDPDEMFREIREDNNVATATITIVN